MWVRVVADFDFKPRPQITIALKAGQVRNVTRACAAAAGNKAVKTKAPRREVGADGDGQKGRGKASAET